MENLNFVANPKLKTQDGADLSDGLQLTLYHHGDDTFRRLKRKKWFWQFLASGEVTWNMVSTTYQTYNVGYTADNRFWALQDYRWNRKIVTIAEVSNFKPEYKSEIAHKLLNYYENGGEWVLNQMTEFGEISLPTRLSLVNP